MGSTSEARKRFDLENSITANDDLYKYDEARHSALVARKPWKKDPHYFKHVRISAIALLKMVIHARSGGNIEVMGLMQGRIEENVMIVTDAFALPVEGTETRVNAQAEAFEYMVGYMNLGKQVGRKENAIGWYHSHPGYGCWLSGIDVGTQMLHQTYQEPWVAVVIDPTRTISAGKVEIGVFRTYPKDYKPPNQGPQEYQTIPLEKIEDFGVHAKSYYPLSVSYFKSSQDAHLLDLLWNKYWVATLSASPLIANREYTTQRIGDLAGKLEQADTALAASSRFGGRRGRPNADGESELSSANRDSNSVAVETVHGLMSQVLKDYIFNRTNNPDRAPAPATRPVSPRPSVQVSAAASKPPKTPPTKK